MRRSVKLVRNQASLAASLLVDCMRRRLVIALLSVCVGLIAHGQNTPVLEAKAPVLPASGFVSPGQYVNAFFGFSLLLPKDGHFQIEDLSDSDKALQHFLFAEKSVDKGITLLLISAAQVLGPATDEAQKAAFIRGAQGDKGPEAVDIGRRLFWKSDVEQKTFSGKLRRLRYATALPGFVLQFTVSSYNSKLADELRDSIEAIKFFDPAKAREVAGTDSHSFLPEAARLRLANTDRADLASLDPGTVSGNSYSNPSLGFSYSFPEKWKAASKSAAEQMTGAVPDVKEARPTSLSGRSLPECTRVFLAVTAPEIGTNDGTPARKITILGADPSCFVPDLKFPASVHDQESIELFGQALFRAFSGTPLIGKDAKTIRAVDLSGHIFLEVISNSMVPVPGTSLLRKVHGSFVMTAMKDCWVIWLFESDTESELARMMNTSISFDSPQALELQAH